MGEEKPAENLWGNVSIRGWASIFKDAAESYYSLVSGIIYMKGKRPEKGLKNL